MKYYNEEDYLVQGSFYKVNSPLNYLCRNVLEIKHKSYTQDKDDKKLLVVMMNPGSCTYSYGDEIKTYEPNNILNRDFRKDKLIKAEADDIQKKFVMNIMHNADIKFCRVINLFDYKNASSGELIEKIKLLDKCGLSVFDKTRLNELNHYTKDFKVAFIGTGVDKELEIYTKRAIEYLEKKEITIVGKKKENTNLYYHPSRKSKEWIKNICKQIKIVID